MPSCSVATVVIGKPLVDFALLGFEDEDVTQSKKKVFARILVQLGWFAHHQRKETDRTSLKI